MTIDEYIKSNENLSGLNKAVVFIVLGELVKDHFILLDDDV